MKSSHQAECNIDEGKDLMGRLTRSRSIKKTRRVRFLQYALVVLLVGGLMAGALGAKRILVWAQWHYATITLSGTYTGPVEGADVWAGPKEPLNFVVIGIDKGSVPGEGGYFRSDVLMLASVDFKNKRVALVSIPRDTKVILPGHGEQKINAAHAFNGPQGTMEAVKDILGVPVHYYVEVDFEAFKGIVDTIGGVPVHMDYEIQDTKVGCLGAGDIWLTGKDALVLCRSRALPDGDLDRIKNQQKFLTALAKQAIANVKGVDDMKRVLDAIVPYLTTSMQGGEMLNLARYLQGIKIDDIQMATIPGSEPTPKAGQLWYYVHDPVGTAALMENVKKYCMVTAPAEDTSAEQVTLSDNASLPLMILNGSGKQGMANKVADVLRGKSYSPATGNAANVYDQTTVYVVPGYSNIASQVVKDFWGNKNPLIKVDEEVTGTNGAKVVVVIGRDYNN